MILPTPGRPARSTRATSRSSKRSRSLRPSLHRYCSRMTGSVLDGEDVVQEALFQAYRKLDTFDEARPLAPWLFRIAHNRCIDFLRRRGVQVEAETAAMAPDFVDAGRSAGPGSRTRRRASGDRAAAEGARLRAPEGRLRLHARGDCRARRLDGRRREGGAQPRAAEAGVAPEDSGAAGAATEAMSQLLHLYVERFNRRDWDGLRELISADARLQVADRFVGPARRTRRTSAATSGCADWRMALGDVDGEPAIVSAASRTATAGRRTRWSGSSIVDGQVVGVVDYHALSVGARERVLGRRRRSRDVSPAAAQP